MNGPKFFQKNARDEYLYLVFHNLHFGFVWLNNDVVQYIMSHWSDVVFTQV